MGSMEFCSVTQPASATGRTRIRSHLAIEIPRKASGLGDRPPNRYGRVRQMQGLSSSLPWLILRNVPFAVVIPLSVTPSVAFAVVFDGTRRPMRISILPLHLG